MLLFISLPKCAEGKLPPDEPINLPPLPLIPKNEKRKLPYGTPQQKKVDSKDRDWERDRDFELMPPPGSQKKDYAPIEIDQPIDPNEPTYCVCHQVLAFPPSWLYCTYYGTDLSKLHIFSPHLSGIVWRYDCL